MRIQAAWRALRLRRSLPRVLGLLYARTLLEAAYAGLTARAQAKAFLRARNRRIELLRKEICRNSGITSYLYRKRLADELEEHLTNAKHRLRGALILQAWWRGCRFRGWPGRKLGQPHRRRPRASPFGELRQDSGDERVLQQCYSSERHRRGDVAGHHLLASALKAITGQAAVAPNDCHDVSSDWSIGGAIASTLAAPFTFVASALSAEQTATYPRTNVKRVSVPQVRNVQLPRKVVIFYSDTGGGHRASALALEAALRRQCGDKVSVTIIDFIRAFANWPWSNVPEAYQALGQFPAVYKKIYEAETGYQSWGQTRQFQLIWYFNRESVLAHISGLVTAGVDLMLSVHPLVNHLVGEALGEIFDGARSVIPLVTVVTDLGSAHFSWFDSRVDALFVPSREIQQLALQYNVPERKIHLCGLPVREGFWGLDTRPKQEVQELLGLAPSDRPEVVLLMGGGEGFGSIVEVAVAIGATLAGLGFGQLVVICGRNQEVKRELETSPWWPRQFTPKILGFVSNVDEYMSAADCLVTKAGPGSIAEAMIKGLPCLLTSFIPGQEEGNVTFVTQGGAGEFVPDSEPQRIAGTIAAWLEDPGLLLEMSAHARSLAKPHASLDITKRICLDFLDLGVDLKEEIATAAPMTGPAAAGCAVQSRVDEVCISSGRTGQAPARELVEDRM